MADYIDRDATLEQLRTHYNTTMDGRKLYHPSMALAMRDIENMPAADVVEVVRCKECKKNPQFERKGKHTVWCRQWRCEVKETDFCSYGERRGSDG